MTRYNDQNGKTAGVSSRVIDFSAYKDGEESVIDQATAWLVRLHGADADLDIQAEFALWLAQDAEHKVVFDELTAVWDIAGPPSAKLATHDRPMPRYAPIASLASAASVLITTLLLVLAMATPVYSTAKGEQRRVVLQDGSVMHLNTDTRVAVRYARHARDVELIRGEAWFDVRKNPLRPFSVTTTTTKITALGTAFAVHARSNSTTVSVTEGSVQVSAQLTSTAANDSTLLSAGQMARVDTAPGTAAVVLGVLDEASQLSWRSGQLVYNDASLGFVLEDLSRYLPKNMALADESIADMRVSAVLHLADQETMLQAVATALPLKWKSMSDELILITPQ